MKLDEWHNSARISEAIDCRDPQQAYTIMCEHFGLQHFKVPIEINESPSFLVLKSVILWQDGQVYSWSNLLGWNAPMPSDLKSNEMIIRYS